MFSSPKCGKFAVVALIFYMSGFTRSARILQTTEKPAPTPEQPPLVFPEDSTKYKIIPSNSSFTNVDNATDAEMYDMLHAPQFEGKVALKDAKDRYAEERAQMPGTAPAETIMNPKLQSELIQKTGAEVERDSPKEHEDLALEGRPGRYAALAAAIVLALAATAYAAMVLWRKSLERKYGSRQILVNEDDTTNHFKHSVL